MVKSLLSIFAVLVFLIIGILILTTPVNLENYKPGFREVVLAPGLLPLIYTLVAVRFVEGRKGWLVFFGLLLANLFIHLLVTSTNAHASDTKINIVFWLMTLGHAFFVFLSIRWIQRVSRR